MARCIFDDFDGFADATSGVEGRYIPTAKSQESWWIDATRIGRLRMQHLQVGAAAAFAGDGDACNDLMVAIPQTPPHAIRIDGEALHDDALLLIRRGHPLTYSSSVPSRWASFTIPWRLGDEAHFMDDADWEMAARCGTTVRAHSAALRRVSLLVAHLCSGGPSIDIGGPAAMAAAEEEVLMATANLLRSSAATHERRLGRPRLLRERIIARCLDHCREQVGQPILVSDLCRVGGVSERTLRSVFHEYFGVGPLRFLKARQLQEIRSALMKAGPAQTVSRIAAQFGVWDFSLFARNYRAFYGESPSDTVRNWRRAVPIEPNLDSIRSWMSFASRQFVTI